MTLRQSNNHWSGGIAAHPAQHQKFPSAKIRLKSSGLASIFWDQDGILLIDYLPNGQTINVEYYSSLLVQLKDILKVKRLGKLTKAFLFLYDNALSNRALPSQQKLAYLGFQYLDHYPFSGSGPVGQPPVSWTKKYN
jgi:hypothetical protein